MNTILVGAQWGDEGKGKIIDVLTEWNEFKSLPWAALKKSMLSPLLFDGRNLLDPQEMRALGFTYTGIGH